jgi:hypothetical protein
MEGILHTPFTLCHAKLIPNARAGVERYPFAEGGTTLAIQTHTDDTNAVLPLTIESC